MKVKTLTEIQSARGIIPAGQIIEIPVSVMLKLKGKVEEITPVADDKPSPKKTSCTSKVDLTPAVIVDLVAPVSSWSLEMQSLVDWFVKLELEGIMPFYLEPHIHVADPVKFFASLRREIETGPRGPRARLGALQADLLKLKIFLN
jgi:hypothetical protein